MSDVFWLSRTQLLKIKPYFPLSHGVPRACDRRVVSRGKNYSISAYSLDAKSLA